MKKQKQQFIQKKAKKSKKEIIEALEEYLAPMFVHQGNVEISYFQDEHTANWLAALCDVLINIHDTNNGLYFCADDVLTKKIIVENYQILKFWGVIYWLETPIFYKINKSGLDPFYAEFTLTNNSLSLKKLCFGDWDEINLNKHDWVNMHIDWIYNFS
ncbi:MAG: hypothetical protein MUC49_18290 [Raineya sp.]|jgi:hypothetical protein|nr:hypothetical protein [Raineya sp.]